MAWKRRTGIMLCQPLDERSLKWNFSKAPYLIAQPKLDGMRCHVEWTESGLATLWSSEGNYITSVPHIDEALEELARSSGMYLNFDGELYSPRLTFEEIMSRCKRTKNNLHPFYKDIEFHIFDTIDENRIQKDRIEDIQKFFCLYERRNGKSYYDIVENYPLRLVESFEAGNEEVIEEMLDDFISHGYEGIILRNPLANYLIDKRPRTILKWKPGKADWYKIVSVEEAISEKGEPLGRVGSIVCEDSLGETFKVGAGVGMSHSETVSLWNLRDGLPGNFVKVSYQNLTSRGVPRFGKFVSFMVTGESEEEE